MLIRLFALVAYAAALVPIGANHPGDSPMIRICSANGIEFAPLINRDENAPQKRNNSCHFPGAAERPKIRAGKAAL